MRRRIVAVWRAVVIILALHSRSTTASRAANAFKLTPQPNTPHHFLNFMPKRWIPASAPSRKHNDLGLQSWRFP